MIATMTTVPVTGEQLAANLAANLVADNTRVAGRDGQRCAVCGTVIRAGERVADLTGSRGLVHVSCSSAATAAAPSPRQQPQDRVAQAASLARTEPSAQPSRRRRAHAGAQAG